MMAPCPMRPKLSTCSADPGHMVIADRFSLRGGRPGVGVLNLLRSFSAVSSLFSGPGRRPGGCSTRMSRRANLQVWASGR